jgi:hypothetical protein
VIVTPTVAESTFERAFKRHLVPEQRREVLDTLRATLRRETTLGELVDAADELGWGEAMGDLRLSDLADALLVDDGPDDVDLEAADAAETPETPAAPTRPAAAKPGRARPTAAARKKPGKKAAKKPPRPRSKPARKKR